MCVVPAFSTHLTVKQFVHHPPPSLLLNRLKAMLRCTRVWLDTYSTMVLLLVFRYGKTWDSLTTSWIQFLFLPCLIHVCLCSTFSIVVSRLNVWYVVHPPSLPPSLPSLGNT